MMFDDVDGEANQNSHPSTANTRQARIGTHNQTKLGVCIFLSTPELRQLGIDPEKTELVEYQITEFDGKCAITISSVSPTSTEASPPTTTD